MKVFQIRHFQFRPKFGQSWISDRFVNKAGFRPELEPNSGTALLCNYIKVGSGTYYVVVVLVGVTDTRQQSLRLRHIKSDRDEILQDCLSFKYTLFSWS